jgi:uncharacterized protein
VTPILLDTGMIVGLLDPTDQYHDVCLASLGALEQPLVTCEAVISESCFLLRKIPGAAEAIVANVEQGIFQLPFRLSDSAAAVRATLRKYRDVPADFADACLICMADLLGTGEILTLNRDFLTYRWRRTRPFELLISLG